ncbi:staphylococcal nuclease domain-containing protein 1 [Leptidea sinapis]|uniref:staphylococcal nuclease domain-containing protein 1 n=1 Tax=Leptidea sinapis TaxID=189913 RepID=UPI00212E8DE9|nr:staphylococcal nuclease domain-containing protein 1 [Leptidea sinapis]
MSVPAPAPAFKIGIVKQVLSGDTIVIRKQPIGGPPPEKTITLSGISAPKLARQRTPNSDIETPDEPFAWEAREFLRKKLVGKEVIFTSEKPANSTKEYGNVWGGKDANKDENMTHALLAEGLVKVREGSRNIPQLKKLVEIEEMAKSQGKGVWGTNVQNHVRQIKWNIENPKQFVNKMNGEPIKAIIEYVRDGSTVRACLLPDYIPITLMMSGIRCPVIKQDGEAEPFADEARFFVESKLLQRDVEIILESVNNNNFVGTILHPLGNIAEALLIQGFAKCVDWSIAVMKSGAQNLRKAESIAKANKLRIWTNYTSTAPLIPAKDKQFSGTVMEIVNGDAIVVKTLNNVQKKVFLSSIRPPREKQNDEEGKQSPRPKGFKPLYDIPWMYEAREFLRKKLIGKKVNVTVDYIQPAKDNFPEKICCTVVSGGINIAEALVSKGYATVVKYRNDNDQRSSHYDKLYEAEVKALGLGIGVHAKKDIPTHRIQDTSGDPAKAKKFFPFLKRAKKTEAVVEFVASGSRMRLYIPKESVLVTFLLAGVNCPRGARPTVGGGGVVEAEPFGEDALIFTKEKCLQRDVNVTIEDIDKAGNFIGWLWLDNENISVSIIEHGFATMHHTGESSEFARQLKSAEETARNNHLGIWKDYVEVEKEVEKEKNTIVQDRTVKYEKVIITDISEDGRFFAQNIELGTKLEALLDEIRQNLKSNAPLPGSFTAKKGNICAAQFSIDKQWYRARVEKITENKRAHVLYIDYGNREVVDCSSLAMLPANTASDPPYATEYVLFGVKFPSDPEDRAEAVRALSYDTLNKRLLLNIEVRGSPSAVTLVDPSNNNLDLGKNLIKEGLVVVDGVRDRRLAPLVAEYRAAQESARRSRLNLWCHGDITEDDAAEFGARR